MATAKIKFTQGLLDPPPGEALVGVAGVPVVVSNADDAGAASREWTIEDVPNESLIATGLQSTSATLLFTPDVSGGYMIGLRVVDGSGAASTDHRVFQVPEGSGFLIPPFTGNVASMNFGGQLKGWAKYVEAILRAGSGVLPAVIFDGGGPENLRSARLMSQSPIDNTKSGIVDFGSDTSNTGLGCLDNYATIGGGDQNSVGAEETLGSYGTVAGGLSNLSAAHGAVGGGEGNSAGDHGAVAGGKTNSAGGYAAVGGGFENYAFGQYSCIPGGHGALTTIEGQFAFANGFFTDLGDCQESRVLVRALSTNGAPVTMFLPINTGGEGLAYSIRATTIARRVGAVGGRAHWVNDLLVHGESGGTTIDVDTPTIAEPNGQTWTIVYDDALANQLRATFTGTVGQDVRVAVRFDWVSL